jgi:hypothetical protein
MQDGALLCTDLRFLVSIKLSHLNSYLSVGSLEKWRPYYKQNKTAWDALSVGLMDGWDEQWLDIRKLSTLVKLMTQRMSGLKTLGCDVVETDNLDCYDNDACWKKMAGSSQAQVQQAEVTYVSAIADAAHSLDMSITFKNAVDIVPLVATKFDGAVVESCVKYKECANFNTFFTKKNKAVFAIEYRGSTTCSSVPVGFTLKYCRSADGSVCSSTTWTNCLAPANPLPPTVYV